MKATSNRILFYVSAIIFCLVIGHQKIAGQITNISGAINEYAAVFDVLDSDDSNPDSVKVSNPGMFSKGDIVMLMQMKGVTTDNAAQGNVKQWNYAGTYEFLRISKIDGNIIRFSTTLSESSTYGGYNARDLLQLVKVPIYENARITGDITGNAWNANDTTGGIISLIVNDTLYINANIQATGIGFQGGAVNVYDGSCVFSNGDSNLYFSGYFPSTATNLGALKGESVSITDPSHSRGAGKWVNGGGGGTGYASGGAGGSNFGAAGGGGRESQSCPAGQQEIRAKGGTSISDGYTNPDLTRVFLGGGGGAGTGPSGLTPTTGGDGGGIVIIMADVIIANGASINAAGESVENGASGGAGGGGGGGVVLLDVNKFEGDLNISVNGGDGGSTTAATETGPGGGGGGGVIWTSIDNLPTSLNLDTAEGDFGRTFTNSNLGATEGISGTLLHDLLLPLRGFLFNFMPDDQIICENEVPDEIMASQPKGGSGTYTYLWQQRGLSSTWTNAAGNNSEIYYQPPPLTDTTLYRRIVTSVVTPDIFKDTSLAMTIHVVPDIQNNNIQDDEIICMNTAPSELIGSTPQKGDGSYSYTWISSANTVDWAPTSGSNEGKNYQPPTLTDTIYYSRVVNSSVCVDTSNQVTITVLNDISNNGISAAQDVCHNSEAKTLEGTTPDGGDYTYDYTWQISNGGSSWSDASPGNTGKDYAPGVLTQTRFYRRVVQSGLNDVCDDTSNVVELTVIPRVTNNTITEDQTICEALAPEELSGSTPSGGDNSYRYQWEESRNTEEWDSITTITSSTNYSPDTLHSGRYFHRIVRSGLDDACKDTSNHVLITVIPSIENNLISGDTVICAGQTTRPIAGNPPAGATGAYNYSWEMKNEGDWQDAPGENTNMNYQPPVLNDTVSLRRKVTSSVCGDFSNEVVITVLSNIGNNTIPPDLMTCYNTTPGIIEGSGPTGGDIGNYDYTWIESLDQESWEIAEGNPRQEDYQSPTFTEEHYFKRIITSGLNDCCKDTSNILALGIHPLPKAHLVQVTDTICEGETYTLQVEFEGNSPWELTYNGTQNTVVAGITDENYNLDVSPVASVTYTIESVEDVNGCFADTITGNAFIKVYEVPVANAGNDDETCGLNYQLKAVPSVGNGQWHAPSGTEFVDGKNEPVTGIVAPDYGIKDFTWKEINGICEDEDEVEITFYEQPDSTEAGENQELDFITTTTLNALPATLGSGSWKVINGNQDIEFSDTTNPNATVSNLSFGENKFEWIVKNGACPAVSDSVLIVINDLFIPNGISPTATDGKNDFFVVKGIENTRSNELIIYNRWGREVWKQQNYNNSWNGVNFNGEPLPPDTYYYILIVNEEKPPRKGFIVIK